jgi:lipoprotein-anchoring transpeptidase ErfK/SrfK
MSFHCGAYACPTHSSAEHACQAWRLASLRAAVGRNARNVKGDVQIVQGGLNRIIGEAGPQPRLETHGTCDDQTTAAIERFLAHALGRGSAPRIEPNSRSYRALASTLHFKRITVSIEEQLVTAISDGRRVYRFTCVTGDAAHPTNRGTFKVIRRSPKHHSRAYDADMHYALFFTHDGKALHQYHGPVDLDVIRFMKHSASDWFGSHGCVRLKEADARALFDWTPIGTPVYVY